MTSPDFRSSLRAAAAGFGMHAPEEYPLPKEAPERGLLTLRRRHGDFAAGEDCCLMELRRDERGVLRWQDGFSRASVEPFSAGGRRSSRRAVLDDDELVDQLQFERLKPNDISRWLDQLDQSLTPLPRGLLRLDADAMHWNEAGKLPGSGKILLLVHGTFSSSENFLTELRATPAGLAFLAAALKHYSAVLAFEHSTLSVSPWLNAMELTRVLDATRADVDILAHSRGGLVARWWADSLDRTPDRKRRCVFVGSPLGGTSGTAPAAIRQSMDLFTNVAEALELGAGLGSTMFPLLTVVAGLLKITGSITGAVASLPIADAVIAAIPGLGAQAATSNNFELQSLRRSAGLPGTTHFAIRSDFQPVSEGWKFWRYFTTLDHATALAADRFIFRQANDLVVDHAHMASLADSGPAATLPKSRVLDLGTNPTVWHCNYFRQEAVIAWIGKKLEIG